MGYDSRLGYTPLECRLYLPQEWVEDEAYAGRRRTCRVLEDLPSKTKPMLGWEMHHAVYQVGTVSARWVTCDKALGVIPDC